MATNDLTVRTALATDPDLAELSHRAAELMGRAYGRPPFHRSMQRCLAVQPDGLAVVEDGQRLVAAGCCVAYPSGGFGWIGLVATEPGHERRGAGRIVTAHLVDGLRAHGCAAALDASAAGAPVYERLGFTDAGVTTVLTAPAVVPTASRARTHDESITSLTVHDVDELDRYDRRSFGASRQSLLAHLLETSAGRGFAGRDDHGRVTGYVIAGTDSIGPLVADDDRTLTALTEVVLSLPWTHRATMFVPPGSRHLDRLLALGFEPVRQLRRMHLGIVTLPGRRGTLAGGTSLGEG